jgi:hypothetical protein
MEQYVVLSLDTTLIGIDRGPLLIVVPPSVSREDTMHTRLESQLLFHLSRGGQARFEQRRLMCTISLHITSTEYSTNETSMAEASDVKK